LERQALVLLLMCTISFHWLLKMLMRLSKVLLVLLQFCAPQVGSVVLTTREGVHDKSTKLPTPPTAPPTDLSLFISHRETDRHAGARQDAHGCEVAACDVQGEASN
jgi:hypothetical protein